MGDVHFWSVWKGGWLEEYTEAKNIGRFMSEYGFQSYPEMRTILQVNMICVWIRKLCCLISVPAMTRLVIRISGII